MAKVYSAPGKALLAGGYLVLDPQYSSYVTALSSRMHAVLVDNTSEGDIKSIIKVKSPQFLGEWEYQYVDNTVIEVESRKNPFIEAAIRTVLKYILPSAKFNLTITIFSDPGYHSQDDSTAKVSINGKKTFLYHGKPIDDIAKTGLGSSAGLTSALTGALLSHFIMPSKLDDIRNKIHNAAQIAHCFAQKKVGSGFDVAAAIYGSIEYQRFDPATLDTLFALDFLNPVIPNDHLRNLIDTDWNFKANPISLPPKLRLLMGDIKGGSNTPNLVKKVLQWKKSDVTESDKLYYDLNNANMSLIAALKSLTEFYENDQQNYLTGLNSKDIAHADKFINLTSSISDIRIQLQKLTKFSGADVEPESQTKLLDSCSLLPGVFGGVVPGAGGFDAICLVVAEGYVDSVINNDIEELQQISWLYLKEEAQGLAEEDYADYEGLI